MKKIFIISIFLFACKSEDRPKNLIEDKKMITILLQLTQADEYYTRMSTIDSTWKINRKNVQFYQQIFDFNKVSRADFYATMEYYEMHPKEFRVVLDSTYQLSRREKMKLNKH
jgi:hypothetical protein